MRHGQPPRSTTKIAFIISRIGQQRRRQQRREYLPFRIGQVTGVAQLVPVMIGPGVRRPHRRLREKASRLDSMDRSGFKPPRDSFETASYIWNRGPTMLKERPYPVSTGDATKGRKCDSIA